jgi:hypothetical protein
LSSEKKHSVKTFFAECFTLALDKEVLAECFFYTRQKNFFAEYFLFDTRQRSGFGQCQLASIVHAGGLMWRTILVACMRIEEAKLVFRC